MNKRIECGQREQRHSRSQRLGKREAQVTPVAEILRVCLSCDFDIFGSPCSIAGTRIVRCRMQEEDLEVCSLQDGGWYEVDIRNSRVTGDGRLHVKLNSVGEAPGARCDPPTQARMGSACITCAPLPPAELGR